MTRAGTVVLTDAYQEQFTVWHEKPPVAVEGTFLLKEVCEMLKIFRRKLFYLFVWRINRNSQNYGNKSY